MLEGIDLVSTATMGTYVAVATATFLALAYLSLRRRSR